MKKLKKLMMVYLMLFMVKLPVFSTGYPVFDISNFMNTLSQLYATYQEIQNTIEQVQNTYKQIEQAAQQVASINWDDLSSIGDNFSGLNLAENPFETITATYNSAQDITRYVNKRMNSVNRLTDLLEKESISFGGMKVSVADLCGVDDGDGGVDAIGFGKHIGDTIADRAEEVADGWENGLSYEQKRKVWREYGMSPRNYAMNQLVSHNLNEMSKEANIKSTSVSITDEITQQKAELEYVKKIARDTPEGSLKAKLEGQIEIELKNLEEIQEMNINLTKLIGQVANEYTVSETKERLKLQEKLDAEKKEKQDTTPAGITEDVKIY